MEILNAWASTLTKVTGSPDSCLALGIYGYQLADAAEIMRTFDEWDRKDFSQFQEMMLRVFYTGNADFLKRHNNTKIDHYWCNWDACNMCSMLAIGVLCDKPAIYDEAVDYFKEGGETVASRSGLVHPSGRPGPMAGERARPGALHDGSRPPCHVLSDGLEPGG